MFQSSRLAFTLALSCVVFASAANRASAVGLDAAVARAKQTGLPLLVIGSGEN